MSYYVSGHAVIGAPPEHRDFKDGDKMYAPIIDDGVRINAFATVDAGMKHPTFIGRRTWLMKHVHVGHDASVGADCELAPGVVVGGHVRIGDKVRIGINACVRPWVTVGDGARIGCGAVVVKDVAPGDVVVGNPARPLVKA